MASATGIPQDHPATIEAREDEPLLGRPGDVFHDVLTIQIPACATLAVPESGVSRGVRSEAFVLTL
jgi:hypothetical protein